ncbi:UNVERIFIED_CONTAM: hypothetical protein PYX00_002696 [Menopon gallinae]|uniref:Uncharacterized protein n=1 Tax=Menopon gallinae TaxID=328185 RepID=A0AAW2HYE7_9NEOP
MNKALPLGQHLIRLSKTLVHPKCVATNTRWDSCKSCSLVKRDFQLTKAAFGERTTRTLPTLLYVHNPVTWLLNKLDFKMLKSAWDSNFDEKEFKRGAKQAVSVICCQLSENLWDNLRGLITRQALIRLQRDVEVNWSDEQRRNICVQPSDIKLALPKRVHFLRISDQRFVYVDMVFVALKFKEKEPSPLKDVVFIEMVARFHRNYTTGQLPNWTVSLFKVTRFNIQPMDK